MYIKEEIQWGGVWVEILSHGKLVGLNLACYQQTKQMSPFSKKERKKEKTLLRVCSCSECKLSKLPFTTTSRAATENYT